MTDHTLCPLMEPRSIAVVGASPREGTLGRNTIEQALKGGLDGPVYPVNPRYQEMLGTPCYESVAALPEPAELVVFAVGNGHIEQQLVHSLEHGARAAVIFTSAYLEDDTDPVLMERLRDIAREANVPVCGANCLGMVQLEHGARGTWFEYDELPAGGISFISHSGTAYWGLAGIDPRLRYNMVVSPGQELVTTTVDYLDYALQLESTTVVGLFLEAIRDPEGFIAVLDKANARQIPVVALKVGQTELSARLAKSHSGALAGNEAAYEAVFEHCGVHRVHSLDELSATLTLFDTYRTLGPGKLASIHDSGGLRGMVIDLADRAGVPFADINATTTAKLADTLAYGLPAVNPVDAWGGYTNYREVFSNCLQALADDPDTAITLMFSDTSGGDETSRRFQSIPDEVRQRTGKPVALALNWSRPQSMSRLAELTHGGLPVLDGAESAILAVKHAFAHRDFHARERSSPPPPPAAATVDRWRQRLSEARAFDEAESSALLADFGVPMAPYRVVEDVEAAVTAAGELGFPVVLKTLSAEIAHKSEVGGVVTGLQDEKMLRRACADMQARLGSQLLVAPMVCGVAELALGIIVDEQFGPLVMVAAGGTLIEVLRDRRFLLPPFDTQAAERAVAALRLAPILDGVRGQDSVDKQLLYEAIARLGVLADNLGPLLEEVDVNPLIVGPHGALAVDALVIPRRR